MDSKKLSRRRFLQGAGAVTGATLLNPWSALEALAAGCFQGNKTVRWVVPYSPGGGFDTYSRLVEPFFEKHVGAEVVIKNVTGAGGINGSRELYRSKPDGLNVGILFGSGVIVANLIGKVDFTLSDYSLLGRIAPETPLWVLGKNSPFKDIWELLDSKKPIVGVGTGAGSASFFQETISVELLGVYDRFKPVIGFKGSRQATMALIRGEADLGYYNYSSVRDRINSGDLRPVMAATESPVGQDNPKMKGIPTIFDVIRKLGRNDRIEDANGLVSIDKVARVIAAPPGIEPTLLKCLEDTLYSAMTDDGFKNAAKKAKRPIDPGRARDLREPLKMAVKASAKFAPLYKRTLAKIGG